MRSSWGAWLEVFACANNCVIYYCYTESYLLAVLEAEYGTTMRLLLARKGHAAHPHRDACYDGIIEVEVRSAFGPKCVVTGYY